MDAEQFEQMTPIYEEMPGWQSNSENVTSFEDLPKNAKAYIKRLEVILEVPIHLISTGPEREALIVVQNPFK